MMLNRITTSSKLIYRNTKKNCSQGPIGFSTNGNSLQDQVNITRYHTVPSGPGSGAGKGGGAGGSVKEAGGKLGEFAAAQEEHYFFNKQKEQLKNIKDKLKTDKPGETEQKDEK